MPDVGSAIQRSSPYTAYGRVTEGTSGSKSSSASWKKLGKSSFLGEQDLQEADHADLLKAALYLYRFNPLVHRSVELMRDYVVGGGVRIEAHDPRLQTHLDTFWQSNDMDDYLRTLALEVSLYGEFTSPVAVNVFNGDLTLGYISPFAIAAIELDEANPRYHKFVHLDLASQDDPEIAPDKLSVIRVQTNKDSVALLGETQVPTQGYRWGECFYFCVNRITHTTRGIPDVLAVADFADSHDQLVFNSLTRMAHEMNWLWDIEMTGANQEMIESKSNELQRNPPSPGSFNIHNEWIKWNPIKSGLEARNVTDEATLIREYVLGGMGLPPHFFAEPKSGGRQIGEAMAAPFFQSLAVRQEEVESMTRSIIDFFIDCKILTRVLPPDVNRSYDVIMPKISLRDLQRTGGALSRITTSLQTAQEMEWISVDLGRNLFLAAVGQLGLGVNLKKGSRVSAQVLDDSLGSMPEDPGSPGSTSLPSGSSADDEALAQLLFESEPRAMEAAHSPDHCMNCSRPTDVVVLWAEGRAMAWFCEDHYRQWTKENPGEECSSARPPFHGTPPKWLTSFLRGYHPKAEKSN